MFTGIVEEVGKLSAIRRGASSARLTIVAPIISEDVSIGDSVAVNGVCLTVAALSGEHLVFDAVPETVGRTSLDMVRTGDGVNLERALLAGGRFGGHFVQGHVDGTGTVVSIVPNENARVLRVLVPSELAKYMAPKGSVALDGLSLTIAEVLEDSIMVWIIPHTWENTTLRGKRPGDRLNIEVDMIARYIERLLETRTKKSSITAETLAEAGFGN